MISNHRPGRSAGPWRAVLLIMEECTHKTNPPHFSKTPAEDDPRQQRRESGRKFFTVVLLKKQFPYIHLGIGNSLLSFGPYYFYVDSSLDNVGA